MAPDSTYPTFSGRFTLHQRAVHSARKTVDMPMMVPVNSEGVFDHESTRHDSQARAKPAVVRRVGTDAPAFSLMPDSLLRLQRTAGNAAVTEMLAVQRKKTPEYNDGQVTGMFTYMDDKSAPRQASISVTDAWFS